MFPRKAKVTAAIVGPLAVLSIGAVGTAQALTVHDAPVHAAPATSQKQDKYTDQDVVGLLALASGPAAQDHPDVAAKFKVEVAPTATSEQIGELTDALVSVDPNFSPTHSTMDGVTTVPVSESEASWKVWTDTASRRAYCSIHL